MTVVVRKPWKKFYKLLETVLEKRNILKFKNSLMLFWQEDLWSKTTTRGRDSAVLSRFSDDTSIHNTAKLISLLNTRPGEFARRLLSVLNKVDFNSYDYIMFNMMNVSTSVDRKVLWQLVSRLRALEEETPRSVAVKGVYQNLMKPLLTWKNKDIHYIFGAFNACFRNEIYQKEFLGKVYISPTLEVWLFLHLWKVHQTSTELATRYSWFELPKGFDVVRFFQFWTNDGNGRTDLDSTLTKLLKDRKIAWVRECQLYTIKRWICYWWKKVSFKHSGDYQDAPEPDGAIEYVDIRGIEHLLNSDEAPIWLCILIITNPRQFLAPIHLTVLE